MNLSHLKYAVEVSNTLSISRAAEKLFMSQPNLSRAIRELEESLGVTIFERSARGISVTPDGEEFLTYARRILSQVEEVESLYRDGRVKKQKFSASVPRASYISRAFERFAKDIETDEPAEIFYKETNTRRTLLNVTKDDYDIGIIRYQTAFDQYFERTFEEQSLERETITEFSYVLLTSKSSPLARMDGISPETLRDFIEISHADPYVPSMPLIDVRKAELSQFVDKHIFVFERGSQFGLLESVPNAFMWVSPVPKDLLDKYGLVEIACGFNEKRYRDVLIYRKGFRLSRLDELFIEALCRERENVL